MNKKHATCKTPFLGREGTTHRATGFRLLLSVLGDAVGLVLASVWFGIFWLLITSYL